MPKSYIDYVLTERKPKTDVYLVYSRSSMDELGEIKWYAPWRQYCFFPSEETIWSKGCLNEVNSLIDKFMDEWRTRRSEFKKWQESGGSKNG